MALFGKKARAQGLREARPRDARDHVLRRGRRSWPHFEPIVRELTGPMGREICYLTSSADDPILEPATTRIHAFEIGEGVGRAYLFQTMEVGVLVATVPQLGISVLPRSRRAAELGTTYVYVFHSMVSTHMIYEPDGFDHYDTVLLRRAVHGRRDPAARGAVRPAGQGAGRARLRPARRDPRRRRDPARRVRRERSAGRARRAVVGTDVHLRDVRRASWCACSSTRATR